MIKTLRAQIARILHPSAAKADPDHPATDLGMDSSTGVKLGMATEECFEVKPSVMMLAEGATVRSLVQKIAESVHAGATDGQEVGAVSDVEQQLAPLSAIHGSEISNDELQRVICEMTANRIVVDVLTEATS